MTDTEMRIAIAKERGWELRYCDFHGVNTWHSPNRLCVEGSAAHKLPNYPEDLNLCHEMEEMIINDASLWAKYAMVLMSVMKNDIGDYQHGWCIHANARQRCIAFLRTIGLYTS